MRFCKNCNKELKETYTTEYTSKKGKGKKIYIIKKSYIKSLFCNQKCRKEYTYKKHKKDCLVCGKEFSNFTRSLHCSRKCANISRSKKSFNTCIICGKSFSVWLWNKNQKCCSIKCRNKEISNTLRKRNKENPRKLLGKEQFCCICGKSVGRMHLYRLKLNKLGFVCSKKCKGEQVKKMYKNNPKKLIAMKKKVSKKIKALLLNENYCLNMQKGLHVSPNSYERKVNKYSPQFVQFVGDRKYKVVFKDGSVKFPDFIVTPIDQTHKVIEVASVYWHTKDEMDIIIKKYNEIGYDCLVLWDTDLQNLSDLWQKILHFCGVLEIKLKKVNSTSILPTKAHVTDAGYDLYSSIDIILPSGEYKIVPCGIHIAIPFGLEGIIRGRSSLALKGIMCHIGTIDCEYRGELGPILYNFSKIPYKIKKGDRVCQIIFSYVDPPPFKTEVVEVNELPESKRGENGFGSSGR